jgi:hypothetical protein
MTLELVVASPENGPFWELKNRILFLQLPFLLSPIPLINITKYIRQNSEEFHKLSSSSIHALYIESITIISIATIICSTFTLVTSCIQDKRAKARLIIHTLYLTVGYRAIISSELK